MDQPGFPPLEGESVAMVPHGKKPLPHVKALINRNLRVRKVVDESGPIHVFEQAPALTGHASLHYHVVVSVEHPEPRLAPQVQALVFRVPAGQGHE